MLKKFHKSFCGKISYLMVDLKQDTRPTLKAPGGKVHVDRVAPERRLSLLGLVHLRLPLNSTLKEVTYAL